MRIKSIGQTNTLQSIIDAEPGERVTYWVGHLSEVCESSDKSPELALRIGTAIKARGEAVEAMNRGFCFLVQELRLMADGKRDGFNYLAIRSKIGRTENGTLRSHTR